MFRGIGTGGSGAGNAAANIDIVSEHPSLGQKSIRNEPEIKDYGHSE